MKRFHAHCTLPHCVGKNVVLLDILAYFKKEIGRLVDRFGKKYTNANWEQVSDVFYLEIV
jgi:hypothetical protein